MSGTTFQEIEHKFVLDAAFDAAAFDAACLAMQPLVEKALAVRDTYYVLQNRADVVLRHRLDAEIQQLTLKTREADPEVRVEVNLALDNTIDQTAAIHTLLSHLGVEATYHIHKDIRVFEFPDCEVVRYRATHGERVVHCVEFEAVGADSIADALAILARYELALGFDASQRASANLLDLLVPNNPIST